MGIHSRAPQRCCMQLHSDPKHHQAAQDVKVSGRLCPIREGYPLPVAAAKVDDSTSFTTSRHEQAGRGLDDQPYLNCLAHVRTYWSSGRFRAVPRVFIRSYRNWPKPSRYRAVEGHLGIALHTPFDVNLSYQCMGRKPGRSGGTCSSILPLHAIMSFFKWKNEALSMPA